MSPPASDARSPGLAGIDLNLLVALDALLAEVSVTAAGRRVGLSQPAMSRNLGRLRELLQDPLLVRDGARMQLTPRARRLAPRVRALLDEVAATLRSDDGFDPAKDRRVFTVATNDYCGAVLLPELTRRIAAAAPHVDVVFRALGAEVPARALAEGQLDLAVGTFLEHPSPLERERLFDDGFACLVGPRLRGRLTLDRYTAARHVLVNAPRDGPGVVDIALDALARTRRVAVRVPHFLVAPRLLSGSDLVLTLPSRLAALAAGDAKLRQLAPPLELPRFDVHVVWHPRVQADPAVRWLLEQLRGCIDA